MTDTIADIVISPTYERRASTTVEVVDADQGRVLGRIFPIGEIAHIREIIDGEWVDYEEQFLPGCTSRLRGNIERSGAHFLGLQLGHDEPGIDGRLGYGLSLVERDDGAYGEFQLFKDRPNYGMIREMLGTAWRGLSVSFRDHAKPMIDRSGERWRVGRVQVDIEHIAAVPRPAYPSAGVLSIRTDGSTGVPDAGTPALDAAVALLAELRTQSASTPAKRL